jgi:surface protein
MEKPSEFPLESLPNDIIIKIVTLLFNTPDDTETSQYNMANLSSIRMFNSTIEASHNKVKIVDFMHTRLWLQLLISIGIFNEESNKDWGYTIKEYLGRIVRERRYTSRVHDLIDIVRGHSYQHIRDCSKCLLYHLITEDSDDVERSFLLGEMTDIPVFTNTTIVERVQNSKTKERFKNIKYWDVRNVTDMSGLFNDKNLNSAQLELDLTYWNTFNVRDMKYMFASTLYSINGITNWNTSNVTNMNGMFFWCNRYFNQPLEWNTGNVRDMANMFRGATSFNSLLDFDVSKVMSMSHMFNQATSFNQPLLWDTSNVRDMSYMFSGAHVFNQPLAWNTSNVTNMSHMFYDSYAFEQQLDWDTSNVKDMTNIFEYSDDTSNEYLDDT